MPTIPTLFEVCVPRDDILHGSLAASDFAADLAQVLKGQAPEEYQRPECFFSNTYPTRGLQNLLTSVCGRLRGDSNQVGSIFRLDTNYGGGKTHALIALSHIARGAKNVTDVSEFISPSMVPDEPVSVAAFDGENADPVNGHNMGDGIRAYTPWGELAYSLRGAQGYELIRKSDEQNLAPGADTLRELFGTGPVLILIDELSIYLRKIGSKDLHAAAGQLVAFMTSLFKAVESSPKAAVVYTLAIGKKDAKAIDAYAEENQIIAEKMLEVESVSARKATLLDPTEEDETVKVLCRRLFAKIDRSGADSIVAEYARLWEQHKDKLPSFSVRDDSIEKFRSSFPLHPELIETLKEKTSTIGNFQRVRGMLRILARTIGRLWDTRPKETYAVHLWHIDLSFSAIRQEFLTKLGQSMFNPALSADIAASQGDTPSLAENLDEAHYKGLMPYTSAIARTIFIHSLAFNESLRGATEQDIRYSVLSPSMELSFINDAIRRFHQESAYLDDHPGRPLRVMTEANLTKIIQQQERNVDPGDIRTHLNDVIRQIFSGNTFSLALFASLPNDVDDTAEKQQLVVIGYEATSVSVNDTTIVIPELVARIFKDRSSDGQPRMNRNSLVFIVADEARVEDMKRATRRHLALTDMKSSTGAMQELAEHQVQQLNELHKKSIQETAITIQQAYRHVFFPSNDRLDGATVEMNHITIEVQNASATPGSGQSSVVRVLRSKGKLRDAKGGDQPDSPTFIIKRTPLKTGQITTQNLWNEYRRDPALSMLTSADTIVTAIRTGIQQGEFVYQDGDLIAGKGDPFPVIKISEQALVMTAVYARDHKIWPRDVIPHKIEPSVDPDPLTGIVAEPGIKPVSPEPTPPTPSSKSISREGPLRQVFTQIWEAAKGEKFTAVESLELKVFEVTDAFMLMGPMGTVQAEKRVAIAGDFETSDGSTCEISYEGTLASASQLKDYLQPQLRAARDKNISATFTLTFPNGLILGKATDDITAKLTRAGSVNGFVKATVTRK